MSNKDVECPFCGKKVSSFHYLGQHIVNKDDSTHNGQEAKEVVEEVDKESHNDLTEKWKENNDNMVNEVDTPDKPADEPDYIKILEMDVDGLTDKELELLKALKNQGYTHIEDCDKPIKERDVK